MFQNRPSTVDQCPVLADLRRRTWVTRAASSANTITPTSSSMAYTAMLKQLFEERGLELNTVVRFDNAALGRAMVEAGVGLMLMREEHANQGLEQGVLAVSPIARAQFELFMAHLASRRNDPLIRAFLEAATDREQRHPGSHDARDQRHDPACAGWAAMDIRRRARAVDLPAARRAGRG